MMKEPGDQPNDKALDRQILAVLSGAAPCANARALATEHLPRPASVTRRNWRRRIYSRLVSLNKRGLTMRLEHSFFQLADRMTGRAG